VNARPRGRILLVAIVFTVGSALRGIVQRWNTSDPANLDGY
jgi:hypothetical protein